MLESTQTRQTVSAVIRRRRRRLFRTVFIAAANTLFGKPDRLHGAGPVNVHVRRDSFKQRTVVKVVFTGPNGQDDRQPSVSRQIPNKPKGALRPGAGQRRKEIINDEHGLVVISRSNRGQRPVLHVYAPPPAVRPAPDGSRTKRYTLISC